MLRNLEVSNLAFTELADFVLRCTRACFQSYPCEHDFTQTLVGDPDHLYFGHFWMRVQELLYFPRINILSAADDHVLRSACEVNVSVLAHHAEISRVQPTFAIHCPRRRLRL